jgi:histidinol phosphatase-like enzyme
MISRAVFLDRDRTLNRPAARGQYTTSPRGPELLRAAAEAISQLRNAAMSAWWSQTSATLLGS